MLFDVKSDYIVFFFFNQVRKHTTLHRYERNKPDFVACKTNLYIVIINQIDRYTTNNFLFNAIS